MKNSICLLAVFFLGVAGCGELDSPDPDSSVDVELQMPGDRSSDEAFDEGEYEAEESEALGDARFRTNDGPAGGEQGREAGQLGSRAVPAALSVIVDDIPGFARGTIGGRDGRLYEVTTLDDGGPGSLRLALESDEALWIIFRDGLNGTLVLNDTIRPRSYKTIDARGHQITIKANPDNLSRSGIYLLGMEETPEVRDIIFLNLTFDGSWPRPDVDSEGSDAINLRNNVHNIWVHQCTFHNWVDGAIDAKSDDHWPGRPRNISITNSRFEDIYQGFLLVADRLTFARNLCDGVRSRCVKVLGSGRVHMVNNVIRNWGNRGIIYAKEGAQLFVEHNIFNPGENEKVGKSEGGDWQSFHNHVHRGQDIELRDTSRVDPNFKAEAVEAYGRHRLVNCENSPPDFECWEELYDDVKNGAGASGDMPLPDINTSSDADDDLVGGPDDDVINGLHGHDRISGLDGNDVINGNQGNDFINGNRGDDSVRGGKDDDTVRGGQGNDTLYADRGTDQLYGDQGDDTYIFMAHSEHAVVHPNGDGHDTLRCTDVRVLFEGQFGDDLMLWMSNGGTIRILGLFITSTVDRFVDCGQRYGTQIGSQTINGNDSPNTLQGSMGVDSIQGLGGDDDISGMDGNDVINGNMGDDFINGNIGDDVVRGGKGNDVVRGGQGNDVLLGDRGEDDLYGDRGDDHYVYQAHHENIMIYPHATDGGFDRLVCYGTKRVEEHREGNDLVLRMDNGGTIRIIDQHSSQTVDEFAGCF